MPYQIDTKVYNDIFQINEIETDSNCSSYEYGKDFEKYCE